MFTRVLRAGRIALAGLLYALGLAVCVASAAADERPYERWTDPAERAFSMEVPKGWKVTGGTKRPHLLRVAATVHAVSPDAQMEVFASDDLPVYVEPNQVLAVLGIGEGGFYVDGFGSRHPVQHYAAGSKWITKFWLPSRQVRFTAVSVKEHPELSKQLSQFIGVSIRYDAGEVSYTYEKGGKTVHGKAFVITERTSNGDHSMWRVFRLFAVEGTADKLNEAEGVLIRMAATTKINADWAMAQMKLTADQVNILNQTNTAVFNTMTQGYWDRARRMDAVMDRGARARRGVDDFYDPVLGEVHYGVRNQHNYYWINDRGEIRGTDTYDAPSQYFRPLNRLP
jgi:hypothetical protein